MSDGETIAWLWAVAVFILFILAFARSRGG
jgi:hypothetical protein